MNQALERGAQAVKDGNVCCVCAYLGESRKAIGHIHKDGDRLPVCAEHAAQARREGVRSKQEVKP